MGFRERNYDAPREAAETCPGCGKRTGKSPGELLPGSIKRGPDESRLLCGPCWADTPPNRYRPSRRF